MARRKARGGPWSVYWSDRNVAYINTRIGGSRVRESLGIQASALPRSARDERAAQEAAAERYAELVAGRVLERDVKARVQTHLTLDELLAEWLVEAKKLWPASVELRTTHAGHFADWAESGPRWTRDARTPLERLVDDAGPQGYATDRLAYVLRSTITKEVSTLFAFFEWAVCSRHLASAPPRPRLPRGALGTRSGPQRSQPVDVTDAEALAIIAAMPEWAARGGRNRGAETKNAFRVRDFARFAWETGLRPSTVERLEVPTHWCPGETSLLVTADIDKGRNERRVPLTLTARELLERIAPKEGCIFGRHDRRHHFKAAALKVLPKEKALAFARYDLRHGRAVNLLEVSGDMLGGAHLLGHRRLTTTNRYLRTREQQAARVIAAADAAVSVPARRGRKLAGRERGTLRNYRRSAKEGT